MNDQEKSELRKIVLQIPEVYLDSPVSKLHRKFASEYNYYTFKSYWHALRRLGE